MTLEDKIDKCQINAPDFRGKNWKEISGENNCPIEELRTLAPWASHVIILWQTQSKVWIPLITKMPNLLLGVYSLEVEIAHCSPIAHLFLFLTEM